MADQSKVLVRLQLLGRQAFKADAREAAADVRGIGRATDNVNRSMGVTHGVSSAAAASLGLIARGAGAGAIGIGLLAGAAGKMGLSFDSTMEQNTVSFSHFLGSTRDAHKYLDQLYNLAATTPFQFQDVAAASKQLLAFGFHSQDTIKDLRTIGDTASGLGTGTEGIDRMVLALGQMKVAGVVQGDELRQFQEAGVNVYKYMIRAGLITQQDIGQIGNLHISSAKAIDSIMKGMQRDFGGLSKEQAKTWQGQLSTMKDYASQAAGALTQPIFNLLKSRVFPRINAQLQKIASWARHGGVDRVIGRASTAAHQLITGVRTGQSGARTTVGPTRNPLAAGAPLGALGVGAVTQQGPLIQRVGATIGNTLRSAFRVAKTAVTQFLDAIKPAQPFLSNVLLPLLKGIAIGVLGSVVAAFRVAIPIIKVFATVLGFVGKHAAPFRGAIEKIGIVLGFLFSGPILKAIAGLGKLGIVARIFSGPILKMIGGAFGRLVDVARIALIPIRLVGGAMRGVGKFIGFAVAKLQWLNRWLSFSRGGFARLLRTVTNFALGVIGRLERLPGQARDRIAKMIGAIAKRLGGGAVAVVKAAGRIGRAILDGIINVIKGARDEVISAVLSVIPGPIRGTASKLFGLVQKAVPHASGGVVRSPLQLVGERGPELAALPYGTRVFDADRTQQMLGRPAAAMASGAAPIIIHFRPQLDGRVLHHSVHRIERAMVEAR